MLGTVACDTLGPVLTGSAVAPVLAPFVGDAREECR